jgi:cytosine/adenosine deaminase-related metal-dependent hydrolase
MFIKKSDPKPEQLALWRKIATEIAKDHLPLHVHANLTDTIDGFLDQIEAINKQYPIKNLRWVLAHVNQLNATQLARMRELGMYAAVHPWGVINGGINQRVFGDAAYDMAPLDTIQKSGVLWGFGSDGSRANQILPFTTLYWAVTGKMVGGSKALRQPISREDALIAAHATQCVPGLPGEQPWIDSGRAARGSRRPRSRLPDDSCRANQRHRARDDDRRRPDRVRGETVMAAYWVARAKINDPVQYKKYTRPRAGDYREAWRQGPRARRAATRSTKDRTTSTASW